MTGTVSIGRRTVVGLLCLVAWIPIGCNGLDEGGVSGVIAPATGYDWPNTARDYWPTEGWRTAAMEEQGLDASRMSEAERFASDDPLTRCLLVVRGGYVVFESYYGDGSRESATNLWSVTKSVMSALVGIAVDHGYVGSVDQPMTDYLPQYPGFGGIRVRHALTQTTGLNWAEEGPPFARWALSADWIAEALGRGSAHPPGEQFLYSSGNSHFLSALIHAASGRSPGELAEEHLFDPLGIRFDRLTETISYSSWNDFKPPLPHSWRQDPAGLETGGFGLYLTAREMAKLGYLYLNQGRWDGQRLISESWVAESTRDHQTDIYGRYSYGYQWWITLVGGHPSFLASGWGGQIIGVVPSLDLVVVIKYEAEDPRDPEAGTSHDDMHLFELVVQAVR